MKGICRPVVQQKTIFCHPWGFYTRKLHTPINFSIGYNVKKSKVSHLLQFHGPKSDPGFGGMWQPLESATDPGIFTSSSPLRKHMTLPAIWHPKQILLFRVTNWNDQPTRCSTPPSQIVSCRIFYYLEFVSSRNLLWPEINRTMQSFLPCTVYNIYSVHSVFRGLFFRVPKQCDVNSSLVPHDILYD